MKSLAQIEGVAPHLVVEALHGETGRRLTGGSRQRVIGRIFQTDIIVVTAIDGGEIPVPVVEITFQTGCHFPVILFKCFER